MVKHLAVVLSLFLATAAMAEGPTCNAAAAEKKPLTEGRPSFEKAIGAHGFDADEVLRLAAIVDADHLRTTAAAFAGTLGCVSGGQVSK